MLLNERKDLPIVKCSITDKGLKVESIEHRGMIYDSQKLKHKLDELFYTAFYIVIIDEEGEIYKATLKSYKIEDYKDIYIRVARRVVVNK